MEFRKHSISLLPLLLLLGFNFFSSGKGDGKNSIVFTTLGRSRYNFDIYTLPISHPPANQEELQITDGQSVNFNGFFPTSNPQTIVYVSEINGSSNIYLDSFSLTSSRRRSSLQITDRVPLLTGQEGGVSMKDKPSIFGDHLIYVSTHEKSDSPRTSWAAVYRTHLKTGETRRLTPPGLADFSPAVSPSGEWTAVASDGETGWTGEIQDLKTHLYIFKTLDGSHRVKIVELGGWPSWADDSTLYFHRQSDDGWWSVYRAILLRERGKLVRVTVERVTPPGLHAFTPAASPSHGGFIAVATRRPTSEFRHIELFDLARNLFVEITRLISPHTHHYNPFISPDNTLIGYHKCRGNYKTSLFLENLQTQFPNISLFRVDGSFPSFSPDGTRIAYVGLPGLYVVNRDGTGKRQLLTGNAFSTAWDWKRKDVIYTSYGPDFASETTKVDIISIDLKQEETKLLTIGGENNAFPSPSPDGKWVVFRSGRSGHKNLYVMDAVDGERSYIRRLTMGPWTDTMCNWSPDGEWIAFASDRENPGGGSFVIYLIHPDGSGLKKVIHSGEGGRTNHPCFSPDSKSVVFTSDYAAVSAEPISNPHHYQPYGDIFVARSDGSNIRRLTHNSYEDGTPTWGPIFMEPSDVVQRSNPDGSQCGFDDCHWLSQPIDEVLRNAMCGR
ncbi:DPP6 N-terminal domain-like protein [Tasmannia lanceolata]|uniref:DPP6 N-terminal domain-like protein n=1 Tax=Tasmannia lanceolata TaxID=3420 RepID=UPI004063E7A1